MEHQIKLQMTIQQINVIIAGLSKLPIELGLATFEEVKKQADQQIMDVNSGHNQNLANIIIK